MIFLKIFMSRKFSSNVINILKSDWVHNYSFEVFEVTSSFCEELTHIPSNILKVVYVEGKAWIRNLFSLSRLVSYFGTWMDGVWEKH